MADYLSVTASELEVELDWEPTPQASQASPPSPLTQQRVATLPSPNPTPSTFADSNYTPGPEVGGMWHLSEGLFPGMVSQPGATALHPPEFGRGRAI